MGIFFQENHPTPLHICKMQCLQPNFVVTFPLSWFFSFLSFLFRILFLFHDSQIMSLTLIFLLLFIWRTESLELMSCILITTGIINPFICIQLGTELKKPLTCSLYEKRDAISSYPVITVKIRFPRGEQIREVKTILKIKPFCYPTLLFFLFIIKFSKNLSDLNRFLQKLFCFN